MRSVPRIINNLIVIILSLRNLVVRFGRAACKVRVSRRNKEERRRERDERRERGREEVEVRSRVDGKFTPAIFRGVVGQKGTQCRGQDRFSSLGRRGSRRGPGRLRCARRCRGETGQAHCCRNDAHRVGLGETTSHRTPERRN